MRYRLVEGQTRNMKAWRRDLPDQRDKALPDVDEGILPTAAILPVSPAPIDQGSIGRCTAAAACGMMAYLDLLDDGQERAFSSLSLYAQTRFLEGTPVTEDSGAQIRTTMKALQRFGTCLYSEWPDYQRWDAMPSEAAQAAALDHQALFYYQCPSLKMVLASIVQGFPVEFGFSCPENLFSQHAAVHGEVFFPHADEALDGGHAVFAIGYDYEKTLGSDVGAVRCRNSWGEFWGLHGDFWLPFKFWDVGLATDCWTLRKVEL